MFLLITGQMFDEAGPVPIGNLRRRVPPDLIGLVDSLLAPEPHRRPAARDVQIQLTSILQRRLPARLHPAQPKAA